MDIKQELTDSKLRIAELNTKLSKAYDGEKDEDMEDLWTAMFKEMDYVHSRINRAFEYASECENRHYSEMNKHFAGHIPSLTAGQIKKILEVCGAAEDYEVIKKPVYAEKAGVYVAEYKAAK